MMPMDIKVEPLSPANKEDFYRVHSEESGEGWCYCAAWWIPDWDTWKNRTAEDNRKFREELFETGFFDGYLLYLDGKPAGWCQCVPRDTFVKLKHNYKLESDPSIWAITCFFIIASYRSQGFAHQLLEKVLQEISAKGAVHVQAFPRRGANLEDKDVWTGPESVFVKAGFQIEKDHQLFPVYGKRLN
jgi:GNAT superfamily N-acetyltransferase